jgi:hypothetical protein
MGKTYGCAGTDKAHVLTLRLYICITYRERKSVKEMDLMEPHFDFWRGLLYAEVKEIVELHLYSPSGPSWSLLGRTVPLGGLLYAEVEESVELCLHSPSGPSWSLLGRILPFGGLL